MTLFSHARTPMAKSLIPSPPLTLLLLAVYSVAGMAGESHATTAAFGWVDCGAEKLCLQEHGKPVLSFQLAPKSIDGRFARANYVHPLHGPDGKVVTEDFPKDHLHQRGIFWAWHQLLLNGKSLADPWVCQEIQWKAPEEPGEWVRTQADSRSAEMTVVRDWVVPHPDRDGRSLRVVRETVGITVWPSKENERILDFDLHSALLCKAYRLAVQTTRKATVDSRPAFAWQMT